MDEVITHVGSNDISKGSSINKLIANVDMAGQRLQEMKYDVKITLSSIFLQGYDPPKNVNHALKRYCITKGWDFIGHGNISFRHLDVGGMHLTAESNHFLPTIY